MASFVDRAPFIAKAGNGGNGCVSFHREKFVQNGGPDSAMYYCECGKVDHATITWNTEVAAVHEN